MKLIPQWLLDIAEALMNVGVPFNLEPIGRTPANPDLIVGPHGFYAGMILRFGDIDQMAMCKVEGRNPIDEVKP